MDYSGGQIKTRAISDICEYLDEVNKKIEEKNIDKNKHLKSLLDENKQYLVDMMDSAYQDAFNIETQKRK